MALGSLPTIRTNGAPGLSDSDPLTLSGQADGP